MSRESKGWNEFLADLWRKLSTYEIQKDKKKYNVAEIEYWGESGHEQGLEITKNNFDSFVNKTGHIMQHEYLKNTTITESQLVELNHILSLTLKVGVNKSCSKLNEFVIKGDYVKFSDFVDEDGSLSPSNECKDITAVKVFALNTLFVDRDIKLVGKRININIVSPKWEIIDIRSVKLSGFDWPEDRSNYLSSKNRLAGEPGSPGGSGANFFGIGATFVNGENFTIISNGGRGEYGKSGRSGKDGTDGALNLLLDNQFPCQPDWCAEGNRIPTLGGDSYRCVTIPSKEGRCHFKVYGTSGMRGESGGDGGKGGKGGNSGNIVLFELNGFSGISTYNETGDNGKNGAGGRGGKRGADGASVSVYRVPDEGWFVTTVTPSERNQREPNGIDGGNEQGIRDPETVVLPKPAEILKEYKSYLRENLNNPSKRYALMEFLRQLDNDDAVKAAYDTLELFNELKDLEEQFHTFNEDVDVTFLYKLLLNRISEYALNTRDIENSSQYKKILIHLYTATLGKISYLIERTESNLIINIDEYMNMIMRETESLQNLEIALDKAELINNYKENHKKNIDRKIEKARYAIQWQIMPEIDNDSVRIDVQIEKLINEIQALENQAENERNYLIEKRDELKKTMKRNFLFSVLNFVVKIVSFFIPIGLAIASWIESLTAPSKSLTIDNRIDHRQNLSSDVRRYASQLETDKMKKVNKFNELLNDITQKINVNPEIFNELAPKIDDMKRRLSNHNTITYGQIQEMEDQLRDELQKKHGDLAGSTIEKTSAKKLDKGETMKQAVKLYRLGHDIYDKYKDDEDKLNAITAAIEQKNEEIEELEEYEKSIHDAMIPMMQNVEDHLSDMANDLDDKSHVYLDVTRWQVQSFLKDVKSKVSKMTENFKDTNDELSHCVGMMEDTMTTLINVYDRIQDYQEEQKFIEFFANVSLIAGSNVKITDPRLTNIMNEAYLEKLIRSNQVMMKRKTGIEAFKNFVFPLAHVYFKDTALPSHFQLGSDFDNLLSETKRQMEYVQSKIDIYKTYLNGAGYNRYIKLAPFTSRYVSTKPFFAWKNSENRDAISKLLSGQTVTVTADIYRSSAYKDAIKFSVAEFFFRTQNKTMQSELNDMLREFEIEAKHLGDSHYRCNNKIYRINSSVTSISYYLEKGDDGEPVSKSLTYVYLKQSASILSPYATWNVTLTEIGETFAFRDLEKYKDVIDLQLMGHGSYIDNRKVDYSNLMIDDYYAEVKIYDQLHPRPAKSGKTSNRRDVRQADAPVDDLMTEDGTLEFQLPVAYVGNFVNGAISKVKNSSALGRITSWFRNKSDKHDEDIPIELDSRYDDPHSFEFNRESAYIGIPNIEVNRSSNWFIDNENHSSRMVDLDMPNKHGNLLLFDVFLRKRNGIKYKNEHKMTSDYADNTHAQYLAYSAHAPGNESLKNTS